MTRKLEKIHNDININIEEKNNWQRQPSEDYIVKHDQKLQKLYKYMYVL